MSGPPFRRILTVTLNPTCDRVIEVPGFRVGEHLRGRVISRDPAGKAINVSRALAALCVENTAVGWVGQETLEAFERAAHAAGVTPRFTSIAGATRENVTILDPLGGTETHIRDAGPTVSEPDITRLLTELVALSSEGSLLVFTGSLAPGLSTDRFGEMLDACIARGAAVAVDTSGAALVEAARRPLWLVKPNLVELEDLAGEPVSGDAELSAHGRRLAESVSWVLVSAGGRGAYLFGADRVLHGSVALEQDRVKSTVGCGDALLAGFIAGLQADPSDSAAALRQAVLVAAASAVNPRPATFERAEMDALRTLARMEALDYSAG